MHACNPSWQKEIKGREIWLWLKFKERSQWRSGQQEAEATGHIKSITSMVRKRSGINAGFPHAVCAPAHTKVVFTPFPSIQSLLNSASTKVSDHGKNKAIFFANAYLEWPAYNLASANISLSIFTFQTPSRLAHWALLAASSSLTCSCKLFRIPLTNQFPEHRSHLVRLAQPGLRFPVSILGVSYFLSTVQSTWQKQT